MKKDTKKPSWASVPHVTTTKKMKPLKVTKTNRDLFVGMPSVNKKPNWAEDRVGAKSQQPDASLFDIEASNGMLYYSADHDNFKPVNVIGRSGDTIKIESPTFGPNGYGTVSTSPAMKAEFEGDAARDARLANFINRHGKKKVEPKVDAATQALYDAITNKPTIVTSGYMHVIPDSHFWDKLETLINFLKYMPVSNTRDYLIKGIENTINNGYELIKLGYDTPGPGTFWKRKITTETSSVSVTFAEFKIIVMQNRPTEIWLACGPHKEIVYQLSDYQDFSGRDKRLSPTVSFKQVENAHGRTILKPGTVPKRITINDLYNTMVKYAPMTAYTYR